MNFDSWILSLPRGNPLVKLFLCSSKVHPPDIVSIVATFYLKKKWQIIHYMECRCETINIMSIIKNDDYIVSW